MIDRNKTAAYTHAMGIRTTERVCVAPERNPREQALFEAFTAASERGAEFTDGLINSKPSPLGPRVYNMNPINIWYEENALNVARSKGATEDDIEQIVTPMVRRTVELKFDRCHEEPVSWGKQIEIWRQKVKTIFTNPS